MTSIIRLPQLKPLYSIMTTVPRFSTWVNEKNWVYEFEAQMPAALVVLAVVLATATKSKRKEP